MQIPIPQPGEDNDFLVEHVELLIESYRRLTHEELINPGLTRLERARLLFEAPFGVVSHNTDADPIFNYANKTALRVFEMDWAAFTQLPSRASAAPMNQAEREQLMATVTQQGFVRGYRGARISASGRRFAIEDTTIWNVIDHQGDYRGQAAVFYRWPDI